MRGQTRRFDLRRFTRKALTTTAIAAVIGGGALLTSGTASAATLLAGSCDGVETGSMGDQVVISGRSVHNLVAPAVTQSGSFLAAGDFAANDLDRVTAIPVGQVPNGPGGIISGAAIGDAVSQGLVNIHTIWLGLDPNRALANVRSRLAASCGLTLRAGNYVPPNTGTRQPSAGGQSGGILPGVPGWVPFPGATGYAPPRDYGDIPAATPGIAVPPGARYPTAVPGRSPEFGILGPDQDGGTGQADVRDAGQADALNPGSDNTEAVQLPMLLAVVALAGVTAALVRTWVLRRTS